MNLLPSKLRYFETSKFRNLEEEEKKLEFLNFFKATVEMRNLEEEEEKKHEFWNFLPSNVVTKLLRNIKWS